VKTALKLLIPVPLVVLLLAMMPQTPQGTTGPGANNDIVQVASFSQLQYVDLAGKLTVLPSRSMLELRLIEDAPRGLRLEIYYENGDYSLVDAQAFHLIRHGQDVQEVRLVRTRQEHLGFPRLR
jgi:hypothetical protein